MVLQEFICNLSINKGKISYFSENFVIPLEKGGELLGVDFFRKN